MQIERNTASEMDLEKVHNPRLVWCAFSRAFLPGGWGAQLLRRYDADLLNLRADNATFNGILLGSVVMTEILVCACDAVSGPGMI
jgi:hypothetical protein